MKHSDRDTTNMLFGGSQIGLAKIAGKLAKEDAAESRRYKCAMSMNTGAIYACTRIVQNVVQRHDREPTGSSPFGTCHFGFVQVAATSRN